MYIYACNYSGNTLFMRRLPLLLTLLPAILISACTAPEKITGWSKQIYSLHEGYEQLETRFTAEGLIPENDSLTGTVLNRLKVASEQVYQHALLVEKVSAKAGDARKQAEGLQETYTAMTAFLSTTGQTSPAVLLAGELGRIVVGEIQKSRAEKLLKKVLSKNSLLLEELQNQMLGLTENLQQIAQISYERKAIKLSASYAPYLDYLALHRFREKEYLRQLNLILAMQQITGKDAQILREEYRKVYGQEVPANPEKMKNEIYTHLSKTQAQIRAYLKTEERYLQEKQKLENEQTNSREMILLLRETLKQSIQSGQELLWSLSENKTPDFEEMKRISSRINALIDKMESDED